MQPAKKISLFLAAMIFIAATKAQLPMGHTNKDSVLSVKKIKPIKPPVLRTMLSNYNGQVKVNKSEVKILLNQPIRILDNKNVFYRISSYQFLYKQFALGENDEGKPEPKELISSARFRTAPLPEKWINKVLEDLKAGDELFFFDVIVKDAEGQVMYAPDLKLIIK